MGSRIMQTAKQRMSPIFHPTLFWIHIVLPDIEMTNIQGSFRSFSLMLLPPFMSISWNELCG